MDKNMLNVKQIQEIMGWSYPTALTFATKNGERNEELRPGKQRWFVPYDFIWREVASLESRVEVMKHKLAKAAGNGKGDNGKV